VTPEERSQLQEQYRSAEELLRGMQHDWRNDPDLMQRAQSLQDEMHKADISRIREATPEMLEHIRASILDGWRQVELELSRRLNEASAVHLPAYEEIPESYRKEVEQYYRLLAQKQKKPQQ
jgi:hypothetical protein